MPKNEPLLKNFWHDFCNNYIIGKIKELLIKNIEGKKILKQFDNG